MATPDLTPYIDLRFYDKDPQDVFEAALLDLQTKLPEWSAREGNVEVLLLESLALQVADAIFAINRLPGAIVMALLRLYGINPDPGEQPVVELTFNVSDLLGHEIPVDTGVRMDLPGGLEPVVFSTVEAVSIPPSSDSATVLATGDRYTADGNAVPSGTVVSLIDSIAFVDSVVTSSDVTDGRDPETDDEWLDRGVQRFSRLSETLVLPRHFAAAALEFPAVVRALAVDNFNGPSGTPGSDAGHVTVALYGAGGPVSSDDKATILAALESEAAANLAVHIIDPTIQTVDIDVTVFRETDFDPAVVQNNVVAALDAYLSPATWDWSAKVRVNSLISIITAVEGVDFVQTLTNPSSDLTLLGAAPLVDLGTATVTVSN